MSDETRTKEQLLIELDELRRETAKFKNIVNDLNRIQDSLMASENLFRTAIDAMPFEFWVIDSNNKYTIQNKECTKRWGNVIGKTPDEVGVDREIMDIWLDNNKKTFRGDVVQGEISFNMGGETRYFYNVIVPIKCAKDVTGILGMNIDITDRKKMEMQMKLKDFMINSAVHGVLIADMDQKITFVNKIFLDLLRYPKAEDIIGQSPVFFKYTSAKFPDILKAIDEKSRWIDVATLTRQDGTTFRAEVVITKVKDEKGSELGYVATILDLSQPKK